MENETVSVSYYVEEGVTRTVYMSALYENIETGAKVEHFSVDYGLLKSTKDSTILENALTWGAIITDHHEGPISYSGYPKTVVEKVHNFPKLKPQLIENSLNESFTALRPMIQGAIGLNE